MSRRAPQWRRNYFYINRCNKMVMVRYEWFSCCKNVINSCCTLALKLHSTNTSFEGYFKLTTASYKAHKINHNLVDKYLRGTGVFWCLKCL